MERKNTFWLSLVCAITFACAPLLALAAQQGGPQQLPPTVEMEAAERDAHRTIPGAYRLAYTLTEMDGSKRVGLQHYAIVLDADATTSLRLGSKIPIEAGEFRENLPPQTQISYIDVGMTIDARLRQFANGLELSSHVAQSAVDSQQSLLKTPVIRQTSLQSTVLLNENKPVILGTMDTPGSTHSLQIQVELTRLP